MNYVSIELEKITLSGVELLLYDNQPSLTSALYNIMNKGSIPS